MLLPPADSPQAKSPILHLSLPGSLRDGSIVSIRRIGEICSGHQIMLHEPHSCLEFWRPLDCRQTIQARLTLLTPFALRSMMRSHGTLASYLQISNEKDCYLLRRCLTQNCSHDDTAIHASSEDYEPHRTLCEHNHMLL